MKYFVPISLVFFLCGLSPVSQSYKDEQNINNEFKNVYDNVQPKQFTLVTDTPTVKSLQDGEFVIYSTATVQRIMFRSGNNIFSVNVSCVTAR